MNWTFTDYPAHLGMSKNYFHFAFCVGNCLAIRWIFVIRMNSRSGQWTWTQQDWFVERKKHCEMRDEVSHYYLHSRISCKWCQTSFIHSIKKKQKQCKPKWSAEDENRRSIHLSISYLYELNFLCAKFCSKRNRVCMQWLCILFFFLSLPLFYIENLWSPKH